MNNNTLKSILNKYDQKRNKAIIEANSRKLELYKKCPEIEKIDNDISTASINAIQSVLVSKNKKLVSDLKKQISELKNKKIKLLTNLGYDEHYTEPVFECNKCKDTGYVNTSEGNHLCSCIKQELYNIEYNNSNIYDLKNQNFKNFKVNLYSDEKNFEKFQKNLSPRENILKIREISENFIKNFDDPKENNLLFCGETGLGKTFLSSCIANEMIKKGKTVLYQTAPIMLDNIIDYKFGKTSNDLMKSIYSADLLIIDDLGSEAKNNLKITELFNIINSRLLNQDNKITKTIISTNLSLQELYDTYEERIVSRIIGNYNACYFYGDDIRLKNKIKI